MSDQDPPPPPEAQPFRLRGEPPRAMRLSRRTLTVAAAVGAVALGGVLVVALRSPDRPARPASDLDNIEARMPAEAITNGPKDYSQVPQLGPPLPGDLGRPIVAAQARGVTAAPPPMGGAREATAAQPPNAATAPAIDRRVQAREAARGSAILVSLQGRASTQASNLSAPAAEPSWPALVAPASSAPQPAGPRAFLEQSTDAPSVSSHRLQAPISPYVLQTGSVIPAALITGLRSDLPGQVTAQVTQDVFDSPTGRLLLIPQGSRLVGLYDSEVRFGQRRVLLAWTRLILADGRSLILDREPAADASGFAGLEDGVDHHWSSMAKGALLSTVLGVGAELGSDDDSDLARAVRDGLQDTVNQTGQQIVRRQLDVQPTLTVRPGHPVRVLVTRDLILDPAR